MNTTTQLPFFIDRIKQKQNEIHAWLQSHEKSKELPLYFSVDVRDAGFKMAVIDTNLFPAGFNNLCEHGLADSVKFIKQAIEKRVPNCKNILIVSEEHTRNTWYLENVRILEKIIKDAGFDARIATFLTDQPSFCDDGPYINLQTATDQLVRIHCFKTILKDIEEGRQHYDLIILNNDLSTGIPETLLKANVPVYPSVQAGWHSRHKSHHFYHTHDLILEFARILGIDPWFFSCHYALLNQIDINNTRDQQRLKEAAADLFHRIEQKYQEHHIKEKPYIVVKSDSGTYGMGVLPIENPDDILTLNSRNRNKLARGKSAQVIDRYLLQEGVPTIYNIDHNVSEVCLYHIEQNLLGGFYRSHPEKTDRQNLNSQGMIFKKMCPHLKKYGDCGIHHDINVFDIYRILARIAGIAAHREVVELEAAKNRKVVE